MAFRVRELMMQLVLDPWRREVGFSAEVDEALGKVTAPDASEEAIIGVVNTWLTKYQPCLFGRAAARFGLINYCVLKEDVLNESDDAIKARIQTARLEWTNRGFAGGASGFVIVIPSRAIAASLPNGTVKELALTLANLYLEEPIECDKVYLDHLYLELPTNRRATWEWVAGVNYFSAQGDKRWWQDHRIPAGMAFSVNSVGHMVKAGALTRAVNALEASMDVAPGDFKNQKIDSLEKALGFAMSTIAGASVASSGRATYLVPLPDDTSLLPKCPIELSGELASKNYCTYGGHYHTDYTVPSEYFEPDVKRPDGLNPHVLDFTYLFDRSLDNPDFSRMGSGRRIRADEESAAAYRSTKRLRGAETEVQIADVPRLRKALGL